MSKVKKITVKRRIGNIGEDIVADYLKSKGYIISHRNFYCKYGEIDIIAEDRKNVRYVEVKTRKEYSVVKGADAVDNIKQSKILAAAEVYKYRSFCSLTPHYDVAEVTVVGGGEDKEYEINYIADAF